jgi:hypothetical protein
MIRRARRILRMGDMRSAYKNLVGEYGKRPLCWGPGVVGRKNKKWILNKQDTDRLDWIQSAQNRNQCQAVMNLQFHAGRGVFFTSWATVCFSRTLLHELKFQIPRTQRINLS